LIGRVGPAGKPFFIGRQITDASAKNLVQLQKASGNLELIINDDLDGIWGKGFADNEGAVEVEITISYLQ